MVPYRNCAGMATALGFCTDPGRWHMLTAAQIAPFFIVLSEMIKVKKFLVRQIFLNFFRFFLLVEKTLLEFFRMGFLSKNLLTKYCHAQKVLPDFFLQEKNFSGNFSNYKLRQVSETLQRQLIHLNQIIAWLH